MLSEGEPLGYGGEVALGQTGWRHLLPAARKRQPRALFEAAVDGSLNQ